MKTRRFAPIHHPTVTAIVAPGRSYAVVFASIGPWTLPGLRKVPPGLPRSPLENASSVSHIAHRLCDYCLITEQSTINRT